jgi:hypothetical protein
MAPGSSRPLSFLLDTGSTKTTIDLGTAKRLGLALQRGRNVCAVGGSLQAFESSSFDGTMGGVALSRQVQAMDLSSESRRSGWHMDGILGMDFIHQHHIDVDFRDRTLAVSSPGVGESPVAIARAARRAKPMAER